MDEDSKTIGEYVAILKRRKWSFIVPVLIVLTITVIAVRFLPRIYRSTSTILIEEQEIPRELVMATVTSYAEQRLQAISQRVMSSTKLIEIINRFDLYPEERKKWAKEDVIAKMHKDIKFTAISADTVDRRTGAKVTATTAFTVSYDGRNPEMVLKVANVLASLYLEENLKVREQQTEGASKFLGDEAAIVKEQLTKYEALIASFKEKHINSLPELLATNLMGLDRTEQDIKQMRDQLRTLKEKESYLQAQLATIPTDAANQDRTLLKELKAKFLQLTSRVSDKHPDVAKIKIEIAELEKRLKVSEQEASAGGQKKSYISVTDQPDNPAYVALSSQLAGTQADIESAKRQLEELSRKRNDYQRRQEASPRVDQEYKTLMTERNNAQAKYDDLMRKTMEAKVAQGLEKGQMGERFTMVDPARFPEKPIKPNIPAIILIGVFLGIGAGVGTVSLREFMDQSVRNERDLYAIIQIPVLASIPEIITDRERTLRGKRKVIMLIGTAVSVVVGIFVLHFFVLDLNILWARLVRKFMI
ncbi:MAG: chain-length determining protein [Syntrophus sp. (in: bacteria)]|nr:chain-length determining protein [Syntrophus sp. (in: bacteria)]